MRITITIRGDLEKYIESEMQKTGKKGGSIGLSLVEAGFKYEQSLKTMAVLAAAVEEKNKIDRLAQGEK